VRIADAHCSRTLMVKQSKFIAHILPFYMYNTLLERLKAEHPKARHFVTAFRHLNTFEQIVEGSSDDGEPRGTSGRPTLSVLQGHDLINTAMITVRYFGGTKLGTGGLVRAYSDAANAVIDAATLHEYKKEFTERFTCPYRSMQLVDYTLAQCRIERIDKQFDAQRVIVTIVSDEATLSHFFSLLGRHIMRL